MKSEALIWLIMFVACVVVATVFATLATTIGR